MWKLLFVFFISYLLVNIEAQVFTAGDDNGLSLKLQIPKISKNTRCPPAYYVSSELFPLPCTSHDDCTIMGSNYFCCPFEGTSMLCAQGLKKPKNDSAAKKATTSSTTTSTTITTTSTPPPTTTPKESHLSISKPKRSSTLVCPAVADIPYRFFRLSCRSHQDCFLMGKEFICCKTTEQESHCTAGIKKQKNKPIKKEYVSESTNQIVNLPIPTTTTQKATTVQTKKADEVKISPITSSSTTPVINTKKLSSSECSSNDISTELFPLPCKNNGDCRLMGKGYRCCPNQQNRKFCVRRDKTTSLISTDYQLAQNNHITETVISTFTTPKSQKAAPIAITVVSTSAPSPTTSTARPTTKSAATLATLPTLSEEIYKKPHVMTSTEKSKKMCPDSVRFSFLAVRCNKNHKECRHLGGDYLCCQQVCVQGVDRQKRNPYIENHAPLLGVLPRECPGKSFGELFFPLKQCEKDIECWPRLCCPEGKHKYCKTPMPRLDKLALTQNLQQPFYNVAGYLQCSKPTQHSKGRECETSLDCFPNLCCQDGRKKFCRPPDKSLLGFLTGSAALGSAERAISRNLIKS